MWQHAIIYPDMNNDWAWAEKRVVGLPAIMRVLLTLHGSGIKKVILPAKDHKLRPIIEQWSKKRSCPNWYGKTDTAPVMSLRNCMFYVSGGESFLRRPLSDGSSK